MKILVSFRDILLIARFELLRNLKTWRALTLIFIYLLVTGGGAYIFTKILQSIEETMAEAMGVPTTQVPGAMVEELIKNDSLQGILSKMIGGDALVDQILDWPLLVIFHLFAGLLAVPFLAAITSAESIVLDTASRAARFECLRTGRIEFVTGRFLGQILLMMMASLFSILATFTVGMWYMVGNEPLELMGYLLMVTPRIWAIAIPYLGLGVLASQLVSGANMARILALGGTAFSWFFYAYASITLENGGSQFWDILLQVLPQTYKVGLWAPGMGWLPTAGILLILGLGTMGAGLPIFMRRDL